MTRHTCSISEKTWKELAERGKFGMSFDDVIQDLLKEVKGKK